MIFKNLLRTLTTNVYYAVVLNRITPPKIIQINNKFKLIQRTYPLKPKVLYKIFLSKNYAE